MRVPRHERGMRWWLAPGLFVSALSLACGGGTPTGRDGAATTSYPSASATPQVTVTPALATTPAPSPAPATSPSPEAAVCEARPGGPGAPVRDGNGPYYHQVWLAHELPGAARAGAGTMVLDHASVPDGVAIPGGATYVYYVNGATGGIDVARVDGDAVTPLGPVTIDGVRNPAGIVDPDATPLSAGGVRLAYLAGFGPPLPSRRGWTMCIADGADGLAFATRGPAITFDRETTDPSLVRLADGTWLMAASQGRTTILARSADGLRFEAGDTLPFGGVPELADAGGGKVRLYVCTNGIESYLSGDNGRTWQREGVVATAPPPQRIICDPSRVAGTSLFFYKTAN